MKLEHGSGLKGTQVGIREIRGNGDADNPDNPQIFENEFVLLNETGVYKTTTVDGSSTPGYKLRREEFRNMFGASSGQESWRVLGTRAARARTMGYRRGVVLGDVDASGESSKIYSASGAPDDLNAYVAGDLVLAPSEGYLARKALSSFGVSKTWGSETALIGSVYVPTSPNGSAYQVIRTNGSQGEVGTQTGSTEPTWALASSAGQVVTQNGVHYLNIGSDTPEWAIYGHREFVRASAQSLQFNGGSELAGQSTGTANVTVPGVSVSIRMQYQVTVIPESDPVAGVVYDGHVSANDTVTVRAINVTGTGVDADGNFSVVVEQHP
jgi:hypothetical protein